MVNGIRSTFECLFVICLLLSLPSPRNPSQLLTPHSFLTRLLDSTRTRSRTRTPAFPATTCQLGRLNRQRLLLPSHGTGGASDGTNLIAAETRDTDIVLTFEDELDVADIEGGGGAELGELAGGGDDIVDEVIGYVEDDLEKKMR